jgi:hypothetical protein
MTDEECMLPDCLKGGLSLSFLVITTFSFAILYIMTSRAFLCLSSKLHQFKCCNMSQTLDVFRSLLFENLSALCWNISS